MRNPSPPPPHTHQHKTHKQPLPPIHIHARMHTHTCTHAHTHMHAHTLTQPPPPILNQQDTNANASPTIPSAVVSRKFLEVCCLKPLVASIHCAHDSWPWLFEHLQKKQHITQVKKPHKKRKEKKLVYRTPHIWKKNSLDTDTVEWRGTNCAATLARRHTLTAKQWRNGETN